MNGIINNGGLNAGRKGMKMRNKLRIVFFFCMIMVVSLGCIESQKLPNSNETKIVTPSVTDQKLPVPNETKPLKINDTFETWSRGYWSEDIRNISTSDKPYFILITNYTEWKSFLEYQSNLDGTLFPGMARSPKTIKPEDFNENFIIAAMKGYVGVRGPEIEIENISRLNSIVNITVRMYKPHIGESATSAPYHIVIVKREVLPAGNSIFVFTDTEGKLLKKLEVNE